MAQWSCKKGSTLLIPSGPQVGHKHLFALMLDPTVVDGYGSKPVVLLAGVTSVANGTPGEDSCLLAKGEHPFIDHDSFVDYRFTRVEPIQNIQERIADGVFIEKDACSPELIRKIIAGALKSRRISREHKRILERILFD